MKIVSKFDGRTLYECEAETMLETLQAAVRAGANLADAYLADANLARANLAGANLADAYLADAYLADAYLARANLAGAYLAGAKINWQSHDLLSAILRRAAGNDLHKRMVAGLPMVSRDWCWKEFMDADVGAELRQWAIETLRPWLQDGDGAPAELRKVLAADHERDAA